MEVILSYDPHFPETVRRRRDAVLGVTVHYEEYIYIYIMVMNLISKGLI